MSLADYTDDELQAEWNRRHPLLPANVGDAQRHAFENGVLPSLLFDFNESSPCPCRLCLAKHGDSRLRLMVLCPTCGNKRCPKATNHELACTGSNEPGQAGSVYE